MGLDIYTKGYDAWTVKEIPRLKAVAAKQAKMLLQVSKKHKTKFQRLLDDGKQFYMDQTNEGRDRFLELKANDQGVILS